MLSTFKCCGRALASNRGQVTCRSCGVTHQVPDTSTRIVGARRGKKPGSWFAEERRKICGACEQNVGGRCQVIVELGKPGWIEHRKGIHRAKAKCPIGKWGPAEKRDTTINLAGFSSVVPDGIDSTRLVTFHFNPLRYERLRATYENWLPTLGDLADHLVCYEVVFDDDQPEIRGSRILRGRRDRNLVFQKEAILNLAAKEARQEGFKHMAWGRS